MTQSISRTTLAWLLAAAALFAAPAAFAQGAAGYPSKPIRIVVTFTTGGAPDILARLIGDRLTADWGQPVVVDNKPGAGGNTGADFVAKSPPATATRSCSARSARTRSTARCTRRCPTTWSRTSRP